MAEFHPAYVCAAAGQAAGGELRRVRCGDTELAYTLTRKQVKNVNLRVHPDGRIDVSAAPRVRTAYIDDFVRSKADFILRAMQRGEIRRQGETQAERRFADGETLLYLGQPLTLRVQKGMPEGAQLCADMPPERAKDWLDIFEATADVGGRGSGLKSKSSYVFNGTNGTADEAADGYGSVSYGRVGSQANWRSVFQTRGGISAPDRYERRLLTELNSSEEGAEPAPGRRILLLTLRDPQNDARRALLAERFLAGECARLCAAFLKEYYGRMQARGDARFALPALRFRKMSSRWGSCVPSRGRITMNIYLVQAPERCIRYVVLHELCHMLEANHSPRFWAHVADYMPDWKEQRAALKSVDTAWKIF